MNQRPEIDPALIKPLEDALSSVEQLSKSKSVRGIPREFVERLWTIAVAAIGLIAAFAWDRFLRQLIDVLFTQNESLWILFGYAVAMTAVAAVVAISIPHVERWYRRRVLASEDDDFEVKCTAPHIPVGKHLKE